jgi:PPP family 3-phenylpropionic acid transporter
MTKPKNPLAWRLAFAYAAFFSTVGVWMPYWQIWLADRGFSTPTIGLIVSLASWARVVSNPTAAWFCARHGLGRSWLRGLSAITFLGYFGFFFTADAASVGALAFAVALTYSPVGTLLDGLSLANARHGQIDYGRVRLWGSLSFVGTSWFMGSLLGWFSDAIVLPALCVSVGLTHLALWGLPAASYQALSDEPTANQPPSVEGLFGLLKKPGVALTIAIASSITASHALFYGFGTLLWRADGIHQAAVGWLWAEGVLAEIVLFWFASRGFRGFAWRQRKIVVGPTQLLVASSLACIVRWSVMANTSSFAILVFLSVLHGLTFGAQHIGTVEMLSRLLPRKQLPAAMALSTALFSGLTVAVATPLAGLLCDAFGRSSYWAMSALSGVALILALIAHRRLKHIT